MSNAKLVIQKYIEDYKTVGKTIVDLSYNQLPFLTAKEPILNMKGEKVSKSYYAPNGLEAVRQIYKKDYGNYIFNTVTYPNVFIGVTVEVYHLRWDKTLFLKGRRPYEFTLSPIFDTVDKTKVVGFSSPKQRQILKAERYNADDYLQAQNPTLYSLIYDNYTALYENYLRSGNKTALVEALNNETNVDINNVLDGNVYGLNITIKELILMNLQ